MKDTPSPNRPQVLVVEDDRMISATLEIALESKHYRVLGPVATLAEAHELLEASNPDVALIDYRLAAATTEGLLAALNARHVPTCVLTGLQADQLPVAYADCTVLQKPFRLNTLINALEHARPAQAAS
ncbi:MAG: response regulator [Rhodanobacter sp.]